MISNVNIGSNTDVDRHKLKIHVYQFLWTLVPKLYKKTFKYETIQFLLYSEFEKYIYFPFFLSIYEKKIVLKHLKD